MDKIQETIQHFLQTPMAVPRNPLTITLDYNALVVLCQSCYDVGVRDQADRRNNLNPFRKDKSEMAVAERWGHMEWSEPHE